MGAKRPFRRASRRRPGRKPEVPAQSTQDSPLISALVDSALAALEDGDFRQAEQVALEILRRDRAHPVANRAAGLALAGTGRDAEAIGYLRTAIAGRSTDLVLLLTFGRVLLAAGEVDEAIEVFQRLADQDSGNPGAWDRLGLAALEGGRLREAEQACLKAFALAPSYPGVILNLARSRRFSADDDDLLQAMNEVARDSGANPMNQADAYFALGKACADRGDYKESFGHLSRANALMKSQLDFDQGQFRTTIDRVIDTFDTGYFVRTATMGAQSDRPIFIVGMPRSGTTLVEQVLAAHPEVHGGGELKVMDDLAGSLSARLGASVSYPRSASALDHETALSCGRAYLRALDQLNAESSRVTDKLPTNFVHLGLVAAILPGARVVHCVREPMALCLSIYEQQFAEGHHWAYDPQDIAVFLQNYQRLFAHWTRVLPLPVMEVEYERLVSEQEAVSRELVSFCGLQWDQACLAFHQVRRKVESASNWQVRQPLYASSVARWHRFGDHVRPLREALAAVGVATLSDRVQGD